MKAILLFVFHNALQNIENQEVCISLTTSVYQKHKVLCDVIISILINSWL